MNFPLRYDHDGIDMGDEISQPCAEADRSKSNRVVFTRFKCQTIQFQDVILLVD